MHQAILARAERNREILERRKLRFIRSSSASLPAPVMKELESVFGCPVIESYGMTEASHQMTSNPLPPAARKPGSVGRAAGPEVAILSEDGKKLPPGEAGEVVINGPERHRRLCRQRQRQCRRLHRRLVPHRRPGRVRCRGLSHHHRPAEGADQPRRREGLAAGGGRRCCWAIRRWRRRSPSPCPMTSWARRSAPPSCCARVRHRDRTRAARLRRPAPGGFQGAAARCCSSTEIPKGATGKLQRIGLAAKLGLGA